MNKTEELISPFVTALLKEHMIPNNTGHVEMNLELENGLKFKVDVELTSDVYGEDSTDT